MSGNLLTRLRKSGFRVGITVGGGFSISDVTWKYGDVAVTPVDSF